jgi:hypothetical protein
VLQTRNEVLAFDSHRRRRFNPSCLPQQPRAIQSHPHCRLDDVSWAYAVAVKTWVASTPAVPLLLLKYNQVSPSPTLRLITLPLIEGHSKYLATVAGAERFYDMLRICRRLRATTSKTYVQRLSWHGSCTASPQAFQIRGPQNPLEHVLLTVRHVPRIRAVAVPGRFSPSCSTA